MFLCGRWRIGKERKREMICVFMGFFFGDTGGV
jgi:hypothetical protein